MAQRCQQAVVVASTRGQGRLDSLVKPNTPLKHIHFISFPIAYGLKFTLLQACWETTSWGTSR